MKSLVLFVFLNSTLSSLAQQSRLTVELSGYIDYGFARFNKATYETTPNNFYNYIGLGTRFNRDGIYPDQSQGKLFRKSNFEYSLFFNWQLKPYSTIKAGLVSSYVGATGLYFDGMGGGEANRVFRIPVLFSFRIGGIKKIRTTLHLNTGISLDWVRNDNGMTSFQLAVYGLDTIGLKMSSYRQNVWGSSIHNGLQIKFQLRRNSSISINLQTAIGLRALMVNQYDIIHNSQFYHTELVSNGSYLRIGIGYEFQILKNIFNYKSVEKIQNSNRYIYRN